MQTRYRGALLYRNKSPSWSVNNHPSPPATRDASPELFVLFLSVCQKSARLRTETYSQRPVSNLEEWRDGERGLRASFFRPLTRIPAQSGDSRSLVEKAQGWQSLADYRLGWVPLTPPPSQAGSPSQITKCFFANNMLSLVPLMILVPRPHRRGMLNASFKLWNRYSSLMASGASSLIITAICAHMRFSASSKTFELRESIISSVTSSFRWAGRQCRNM